MEGKGLPSYVLDQRIKMTAGKKSPHSACTKSQKHEAAARSHCFVILKQKLTCIQYNCILKPSFAAENRQLLVYT